MERLLGVLVALAAGGCATGGDPAIVAAAPSIDYFGRSEPGVERSVEEFAGSDGKPLALVHHRAVEAGTASPRALVYLHGIESHAGWFARTADLLAAHGIEVYCLDRRGGGLNREDRGFPSGDFESYEVLLADLHSFLEPLRERHGEVVLAGLSWGGKLAVAHALAHPADQDALILITPGLVAKVGYGTLERANIMFASWLRPGAPIALPIEPRMFSTDPRFVEKIEADPRRLRAVTARFLAETVRLDAAIDAGIEHLDAPVLLFLAGRDRIVDNDAVLELLGRARSAPLDVRLREEQTHSLQFDEPEHLARAIDDWIDQRGGRPSAVP